MHACSHQPEVFDASKGRMSQIPDYAKTGDADNVRLFHGREIRQVPDAAGGMGFVLQLSHASTVKVAFCRPLGRDPARLRASSGRARWLWGGVRFQARSQPTGRPASASDA